jgi:hypothetical protein
LSTPIFACATLPWSVITIQSSRTPGVLHLIGHPVRASLLCWVDVVSPASQNTCRAVRGALAAHRAPPVGQRRGAGQHQAPAMPAEKPKGRGSGGGVSRSAPSRDGEVERRVGAGAAGVVMVTLVRVVMTG